MHNVVFDTKVLVATLLSKRGASYLLLSLIGTGAFKPCVSVALALEYEEVLKREGLIPGISPSEIDTFLNYILRSSDLVPAVDRLRPSLPDPDDELVLDLAAQSAATILTYNKRDFAGAAERGVAVSTPAEFLVTLRKN